MVSFPFDSKITGYDDNNYPIYDRAVDSSLLSNVINEFVSTGVFIKESNGFSVVAGDGMTVVVSPGSAIIRGTTCIERDERTLTVQASDSNYDRIDSVVLRYNNNEDVRAIDLYILQGTASSSPVQPSLTRDDYIYEIAIANIYIPVNSIAISNERITDTRGDSSRCGWATGVSQDFMESLNNRFALVNESLNNRFDLVNESINNNINIINKSISDLDKKLSVKIIEVTLTGNKLNHDADFNGQSGIKVYGKYRVVGANYNTDKNVLHYCQGYAKIPGITNKNKIINIIINNINAHSSFYIFRYPILQQFYQYDSETTLLTFSCLGTSSNREEDLNISEVKLTVYYI